MTRILAIEPSPESGALLKQLIHDNVRAAVALVTSTTAALDAIERQSPDLIVASSLIPPNDERQLVNHLRQTSTLRHLPILTISPIIKRRAAEPRGWLARFRRPKAPSELPYDFSMIAERIEEAIAQSKIAIAHEADDDRSALIDTPAPIARAIEHTVVAVSNDVFTQQERAVRWAGWQLPWLSSVKAPWAIDLRLVNLSSTGLLVESSARIPFGAATTFRLWGPDRDVTVPARIVRSDMASVDRLGVRYLTAARFDEEIDPLLTEPSEAIETFPLESSERIDALGMVLPKPSEPSDAIFRFLPEPNQWEEPVDFEVHFSTLVDGIRQKAIAGIQPSVLRAEFEAGVLSVVTARDVRLRDVPVAENDGCESVFFTIGTSDEPAVLQVTFEANYQPQLQEFAALKAAAKAAAFVVDVTDTARQVRLSALAAGLNASLRLVPPAPASELELRPTA